MVWMLLFLSYFWFVLRAMKLCFNLLLMAITMLIIHPQYPHCHAPIYQLHFITIPRSMHGRHPHPSSPSPFLSLAAIPIPHPHARNLVYLAAHHARVQLISTGTPKAARLHVWDPCMQAASSLTSSLHAPRQQGACSPHQPPSPAPAMRAFAPATMAVASSGCYGTAATAPLSMVPPAVGASSENDIQAERQAVKEMKSWA